MVHIVKGDDMGVKLSVNALQNGYLVGIPTETVYGLAADASNLMAVRKIYEVKQRPLSNPLIVHISSLNQIYEWATDIPKFALDLANSFWPGPLTLILKRNKQVSDLITANQDSVAVRIPSLAITQSLLEQLLRVGIYGLAAPSANVYGYVSPTTALDVFEGLKANLSENDLVLDGGVCEIGIESTIVDCTGTFPKILRPGAISEEKILTIFNENYSKIKETAGESSLDCKLNTWPGMSKKHYSPKAQVVVSQTAQEGDGFFALYSIPTPTGAIRLGSPIDIEEFAHTLYSVLRKGDSIGLKRIVIEPPVGTGLSIAIRDRLRKAAGMP